MTTYEDDDRKAWKRAKDAKKKYRPPVSKAERRLALQYALVHKDIFQQTSSYFPLDGLKEDERVYYVLFQIWNKIFQQTKKLPTQDVAIAAFKGRCEQLPRAEFSDKDRERGLKLLEHILFKHKVSKISVDYTLNKLKEYGEDLTYRQIEAELDPSVTPIGDAFVATAKELFERSARISVSRAPVMFPEDFDVFSQEENLVKVPTEVDYLDILLGGGDCAGDCNLFLAPSGSCKTMQSVELVVLAANRYAAEYDLRGGVKRKAVYVTYEENFRELHSRFINRAALIPRRRHEEIVKSGKGLKALRRKGSEPLPYEKELFAAELAQNLYVPSELERFNRAKQVLNDYCVFLDMSGKGKDVDPSIGSGGVTELKLKLAHELADCVLGRMVVDYAGKLVRRQYGDGLKPEELRGYLKALPDQLATHIAAVYNIPVWLTHQLDAQANGAQPGKALHHTMAAECKTIHENAANIITVGVLTTSQYGVALITKHRRIHGSVPRVIFADGEYNSVKDAAGSMVVDENTNSIVSKYEMSSVVLDRETLNTNGRRLQRSAHDDFSGH